MDRRAAADACLVSERAFIDIVPSFVGESLPRIAACAAPPDDRSMMTGSLLLCTRMLPAMLASVFRRVRAMLPDTAVPSCVIIDLRIPLRKARLFVLEGSSAVLRGAPPPPRMSAPPTTTVLIDFACEGLPEMDWRPATDCRADMVVRLFVLARGFWELPVKEARMPEITLRAPATEIMRDDFEPPASRETSSCESSQSDWCSCWSRF